MLIKWAGWRDERLVASLKFELEKRRSRLEVVQGLITAITLIDEVIDQIKSSKDRPDAKKRLVKMQFTERQADAILDMRLAQLTKLNDKQLQAEAKDIQKRIKEILALTSSEKKRREYIVSEVEQLAERHGNARRSKAIDRNRNYRRYPLSKSRVEKVQVAQKRSEDTIRHGRLRRKGILTQLKGPRGANISVQDDQKIVVVLR